MQQGLLQTLEDFSGYLANAPHAQTGGWIIVVGIIVCGLALIFPLNRDTRAYSSILEPDWQDDTLWPFEPSAEGADSAGLGGGDHVAVPQLFSSGGQPNP